MERVMICRVPLIVLVMLALPSCRDARISRGQADAQSFAEGTVGELVNDTRLTMPLVRGWFRTMTTLALEAKLDTTLGFSFSYPLDQPLPAARLSLTADTTVTRALTEGNLTPDLFIAGTVFASGGMLALRGDSLQRVMARKVYGDEFVEFFLAHKPEIDSLAEVLNRAQGGVVEH